MKAAGDTFGADIVVARSRVGEREALGDEKTAEIGAAAIEADGARRTALTWRNAAVDLGASGKPLHERLARHLAARPGRPIG